MNRIARYHNHNKKKPACLGCGKILSTVMTMCPRCVCLYCADCYYSDLIHCCRTSSRKKKDSENK